MGETFYDWLCRFHPQYRKQIKAAVLRHSANWPSLPLEQALRDAAGEELYIAYRAYIRISGGADGA